MMAPTGELRFLQQQTEDGLSTSVRELQMKWSDGVTEEWRCIPLVVVTVPEITLFQGP